MLNSTIGKYRITRKIGEGGMATVYEAVHTKLDKKVAIKVLNPSYSNNPQVQKRFEREARLMAALEHENITRITDFEEQPGRLCIVMELLGGEDLSSKIRREEPLTDSDAMRIFSQVLKALTYAHQHPEIVAHRDIKPSNIFILPDGKVKILDFGIAKIVGEGLDGTRTGLMLGTPLYMSPEQVRTEKNIDHRTDIYSLGVTMYYALTGKPPYDDTTDSLVAIWDKIRFNDFAPINSKFWPMIQKACKKDRNERYQDCKEWLKELQRLNNDSTVADETIIFGGNTTTGKGLDETVEIANDRIRDNKQHARYPWGLILGISGLILIISIITGRHYSAEQRNNSEIIAGRAVRIGRQIWMTTNLNVDRFRNGDPIPQARTDEEWERAGETGSPAWCYYNNDPANGSKYGKLYNWYAVNDSRGLAPVGYHIPSGQEWAVLTDFLGVKDGVGTKMKSTSGWANNGNGNNSSGFSGLPGGLRGNEGIFYDVGYFGYWWHSTTNGPFIGWSCALFYDIGEIHSFTRFKNAGLSVRCLRD
jgi:uncharacterized protein (TIGR02145 family)